MENFDRNKLVYTQEGLTLDGISIGKIIEKFNTPLYLYSEKTLEHNLNHYIEDSKAAGIDALICFALKSNSNKSLLQLLAKRGAGADIVSAGELIRALAAGIPANKIVFSGVGKMKKEIELALKKDIYSFNVESIEELSLINQLAEKQGKIARIAFRLNPKVHAETHKHISTGFKTHKFGVLAQDIIDAAKVESYWTHCKLVGLSIHIGSQLVSLDATEQAIINLCDCASQIDLPLEFLDVGGGLGVNYEKKPSKVAPSVLSYMELVQKTVTENYAHKVKVVFEPGRRIIASVGFFITSVIRSKTSDDCNFLIVDGGMNDFVRPSLYDAYHEIYPSYESEDTVLMDIVGPICETADCFGQGRSLPKLGPGDFVAIADTGAYGYTMSSNYNLRVRPAELLITNNGEVQRINKEEILEDIL